MLSIVFQILTVKSGENVIVLEIRKQKRSQGEEKIASCCHG